jgi:serine protease Do
VGFRIGLAGGRVALVAVAALSFGLEARAADGDAGVRSVEEIARSVRGSIVTIRVDGRGAGDRGLGTGFAIGDGLIATNLHVIGEARPVSVELADGSRHDVTAVHASDRDADLAIIRIAATGLEPLPLGDGETVAEGQEVVAIGNPHGLERSVVAGRISALREMDGIEMLQLAMPVEPGNSGGPVLDRGGRVLGVVTLKSAVTPNLGFAVSTELLRPLLERPNPVTMDRWLTIGAMDPKEWTPIGGARWRQRAGRITVAGAGQGFGGRSLCLAAEAPPQADYEAGVWVKLDDESGAAGLVFAADGGDRHYGFYPSAGRLRLTRFDGPDVTSWKVLEDRPSPHYRAGEWNHLRVRCSRGRIDCMVNDETVFTSTDDALPGGRSGLASFRGTEATFRGFAVGAKLPPVTPAADILARLDAAIAGLPDAAVMPRSVVDAVVAAGPDSDAAVEARAAALERQAGRLRALADAVHERRTLEELGRLVARRGADIDLFRGALLVARLDNRDLDIDAYERELDRLARDVAGRLPPEADDAAKLATLDRVLFDELGFHGSRGDYHNPANSYVNEVLDDREGIPISLAVIYMELARHLGVKVEGIGFPGHFLVRHDPPAGNPRWLDVFDRAKPLSREALAARLRADAGEELDDSHLAVAAPKAILVRMLNNLLAIAGREDEPEAMLRYLDAMLVIAPDSAYDRVLRMVTAARAGRTETARDDARWLLDHEPDGIDLDRVRAMAERLDPAR